MRLFKPNIESTLFPHIVRGPGVFTPIVIKLSGWGFLKVNYTKVPNSKAFKKFKYFASESITLDVPKDTYIQVIFWNIFGFSSLKLVTPGNNTEVDNVVEPKLPQTRIPQPNNFTPEIFTQSFKTSLWRGLRAFPILNLGGKLSSSFSIVNKYLTSYQSNHSIKIESQNYPKATHHSNYKLKIDFNNIQINNDAASNNQKGGRK